jgi:ribosome maturation factor RimP
MIEKSELTKVIETALEGSELFLVDVAVSRDNNIVVEIDSMDCVSIDDCAKLTKAIESHFDRDVEDYELEVGSAGLTSPFKVKRQYEKYIDEEVEILTTPFEFAEYKSAITEALYKGTKRNVESEAEPKNAVVE